VLPIIAFNFPPELSMPFNTRSDDAPETPDGRNGFLLHEVNLLLLARRSAENAACDDDGGFSPVFVYAPFVLLPGRLVMP
jgi:hypothetical protein